jgi:RimJ/RimL family protein N-acetyltransferase
MIEIRQTAKENLKDVQRLWADGDVMRFVGFPEGLHQTDKDMQNWYRWIAANRLRLDHFSIFEDGTYCGETFYEIDREHGSSAALDIKLFGFARGKGIAAQALSFAIEKAFENGAKTVWVDPNPQNAKAIALYERLGFQRKDMPEYLLPEDGEPVSIYMELCRSCRLKQIFESNRVSFVEVSEFLIEDYLTMVNDYENVNRFIGGMKSLFTREDETGWVQSKLAEKACVFSMIEKKSGDFIGNIEFMDVHDATGELGIAITAEKQDRGYGTEAVTAMTAYGRHQLGLNRIYLRTRPFNARAIRVYEKCGFKEYDRTEDHVFMELQ